MKTFTIHSVRNIFAFFIALGLGYAAYIVSPSSVGPTKVEAGASQNVSGWAWSDNIGWISFNDTTGGNAAQPYGVNINTTSGDITGIALSSGVDAVEGGIGAISFNRADTGNPPSAPFNGVSGPIAKVNLSTGDVTGWARALAACTQDASGNLTPAQCAQNSNAGGWDGWIKLSKDPADTGSTYGVKVNLADGKFSGYAWGGAETYKTGDTIPAGYSIGDSKVGGVSVIGWIKFAADGSAADGCSLVTNDYSGTSKCKYGVKGPTLSSLCTSNLDCTVGQLCNITTGACVAPGGTCGPSSSCGIGQSCNGSNACVSTDGSCTDDAQCVSGQVCNLATLTCVAPTGGSCTTDTDCLGEQICNTSTSPGICYNKPKTKFWQF